MNYAKATTEQELLDMVAYLEGKGYDRDDYCLHKQVTIELFNFPYVGLTENNKIYNSGLPKGYLQGHEVTVSEFLKQ